MEAQQILNQLGALSYLGIFGVSLMANMIIPVPEEIVLLALGYLAGTGKADPFILVPIVMLGLLISDSIVYLLARKGSKLTSFLYKRFFAKRFSVNDAWARNHIAKIIFFSRFLIQLRFIGPFMAGHLKIKYKKFLIYNFLAILAYVPTLIFLGWYFHSRIEKIFGNVHLIKNAVFLFFGAIAVFFLFKFLRTFALEQYQKFSK